MATLIKLFKLLYPFLQEFGLREVNLRQFIANNKAMCYMFLMCVILFVMFVYALEQAHLRMIHNVELIANQATLKGQVDQCIKTSEQIHLLCMGVDNNVDPDKQTIEELLGQSDGK